MMRKRKWRQILAFVTASTLIMTSNSIVAAAETEIIEEGEEQETEIVTENAEPENDVADDAESVGEISVNQSVIDVEESSEDVSEGGTIQEESEASEVIVTEDVEAVGAANPYSGGYGNCTWSAWQICYESTGHALPSWGDAINWYYAAPGSGYTVSTTPRERSIAVWSDSGRGHVGYVSAVSGNQIYVKEGAYSGAYHEGWLPSSGYRNGYQVLVGYIYVDELYNNPQGCVDTVVGETNQIYVQGWAFDRDNVGASLDIHVYIGGAAGAANAECHVISANKSRSDVNAAYLGVGDYHGFSEYIHTTKSGSQPIYIYAINVGGGGNIELGHVTVNIAQDSVKPTISDVKIWNVRRDGYSISCKVTDNGTINRVQFPTWTVYNDQDDIFPEWWSNSRSTGSRNGDVWSYRVYRSDHNNEYGDYITHIYAYDDCGNYTCQALGAVTFVDGETDKPVVSNFRYKCLDDGILQCDMDVQDESRTQYEMRAWREKDFDFISDLSVADHYSFKIDTKKLPAAGNIFDIYVIDEYGNTTQAKNIAVVDLSNATRITLLAGGNNWSIEDYLGYEIPGNWFWGGTYDSDVIKIDNDGIVTPLATGETPLSPHTDTATGSFASFPEGAFIIDVVDKETVELSAIQLSFAKLGEIQTVSVEVTPVNVPDKSVEWKSSNPAIATVTADGMVTAVSNGTTQITATSKVNRVVAICDVTVNDPSFASNASPSPNGTVIPKPGNTVAPSVDPQLTAQKTKVRKPKAPSKIKVKKSSGKPKISWKKVSGATGYIVYRSTKKNKGYKKIKTLSGKKSVSYRDKKAKKDKTYYYKVCAYKRVSGKMIKGSYSKVKKISLK